MKTCFFISTGRTGTAFFTYFFDEVAENSWSTHEPHPAFKRRSFELTSRSPSFYEINYFRVPRILWHQFHDEDWYVETNYHLFSGIELLENAFRDPLTVHIIRDGRDVVRSWLNRGRYLNDPGSRLTPDDVNDSEAEKEWNDWNALQKIAWNWKTVNETIFRDSPDLTLRFESIFGEPHEDVFRLLEQMDGISVTEDETLEALNRKVNPTTHELVPEYEEWPDQWKEQFNEIAGDAMEEWNYR